QQSEQLGVRLPGRLLYFSIPPVQTQAIARKMEGDRKLLVQEEQPFQLVPPILAPAADVARSDIEQRLQAVLLQQRSGEGLVVGIAIVEGEQHRSLREALATEEVVIELLHAEHTVTFLQ